MQRNNRVRLLVSTVTTASIVWGSVACGADSSGLSETAQRGKRTAGSEGCASCHGADGQGGVGPKWTGLAGSEVELEDGTTVVADHDYLIRAIVEPDAEVVPGYSVAMPQRNLTDEQARDIVAYIDELAVES